MGLTVAKEVLYEPKRIRFIVADPSPEVTEAVTVPVAPPTVRLSTLGEVVTWHGVGVGVGGAVGLTVGHTAKSEAATEAIFDQTPALLA